MTRTDIHRPSAINPQDYEFVGVEYDKVEELGACLELAAHRERIREHMKITGGTYSHHEHGGNCHVCGAWAIYTCLFYHRDTNIYIRTGFDCAEKMDMGDPRLFRSIKAAVKTAREVKAGKMKAQAILADLGLTDSWTLAQEMDDEALQAIGALDGNGCHTSDFRILRDIVRKLIAYGSISEAQTKYLAALPDRIRNRKRREAEREAQRAAERAAAAPVPSDGQRHQITGVVISIKVTESDWGDTTKIIVKDDRGFVVMGTVPRALEDQRQERTGRYDERWIGRGDRVQFIAKTEASKDDPKFGFYSRPTKAQLLAIAGEDA